MALPEAGEDQATGGSTGPYESLIFGVQDGAR